jgi:hypothetical protein
MPKNGLMSDGYHRFWNAFGILTNARTESTAEQNNLHGSTSRELHLANANTNLNRNVRFKG